MLAFDIAPMMRRGGEGRKSGVGGGVAARKGCGSGCVVDLVVEQSVPIDAESERASEWDRNGESQAEPSWAKQRIDELVGG